MHQNIGNKLLFYDIEARQKSIHLTALKIRKTPIINSLSIDDIHRIQKINFKHVPFGRYERRYGGEQKHCNFNGIAIFWLKAKSTQYCC